MHGRGGGRSPFGIVIAHTGIEMKELLDTRQGPLELLLDCVLCWGIIMEHITTTGREQSFHDGENEKHLIRLDDTLAPWLQRSAHGS